MGTAKERLEKLDNVTKKEKLDKLDKIASALNKSKKYASENGDMLIGRVTSMQTDVETISSGSLVLDSCLGGGFGKGRVIEVYGRESSGKTSVALTTIANVQRDGGTAVFIDAENAFDPSYAQKLGVQLDELFFSQPDSAEQALDLVADLINTNEVDLIVVDSVAALVPQKELEGDAADVTVGEVARLLSKQLRKMIKPASKTGTTVIFINQIRDKIGGFSPFGTPTSTPGGNALKFYSSQRVEISKGSPITEGKDNVIGTEMKFTVKKNKIAPPFRKGSTVITYNHGINREAEMITVGSEYDTVILRPNNRTYVDASTGEVLGTSKDAAIQFLKDNPEIFNELTLRLKDALDDNVEDTQDEAAKEESKSIEDNDTFDDDFDEDM